MGLFSVFFEYRGKRLVTCPENHHPAAVDVDAFRAARSSFKPSLDLRLSACSRWPEKEGCGQECLSQIKESPADCLVSAIVTRWYAGKSCVLCKRAVGKVVWHEAPPAVISPDGNAFEWTEIAPEKLPRVFDTYQPLCWNCYLAVAFRRDFPELPVDRRRPAAPPPEPLNTTNVY